MSKPELELEIGKIYVIDGSRMAYIDSEGSKHYFQKIDPMGKGIGRRRMIMGNESSIAHRLKSDS